DIVRERLEREYDLELLATMPSVEFDVTLAGGEELEVHNPSDMPDPGVIDEIREHGLLRGLSGLEGGLITLVGQALRARPVPGEELDETQVPQQERQRRLVADLDGPRTRE